MSNPTDTYLPEDTPWGEYHIEYFVPSGDAIAAMHQEPPELTPVPELLRQAELREADLKVANQRIADLQAENDALKAQAAEAQGWEPVKKKVTRKARGVTSSFEAAAIFVDGNGCFAIVPLPDNLRICRKVRPLPAQEEVQG